MAGDEIDDGLGEIGGELDIDAVTKVATTVRRKPLDLGLSKMLPRQSRSGGQQSGGVSLDAGAFMDREEKEAVQRAAGGTPTLDRLGDAVVRPAGGRVATMDRALTLRQQGIPTWGWILLLLGAFAVGFVIFISWIWASKAYDVEAEAQKIEAASEHQQQLERERQRGID